MPAVDPDQVEIVAVGADLTLSVDANIAVSVPGRWLRDHGDDPGSVDPRSRQRVVDTFSIPADVAPVRVDRNGGEAVIRWSDGATTVHELGPLMAVVSHRRHPGPSLARSLSLDPRVRPWASPPSDPDVLAATVIEDDAAWASVLDRLRRDGWAMFDGVAAGREPLERLADRLGYPRRTIFGDIWEMKPGASDHLDSAYDTTALDAHTDGTYSLDGPGVIVFAQQERFGRGGDSVLVDGYAAAADFAASDPEAADLLTRYAVRGHYLEPGVHLMADRPPLRLDDRGVLTQVTFNNYDRAPVLPAQGWVDAVVDAYAALHGVVSEPKRRLELEWAPGRLVVVDNWRLLHGRTAYAGDRRFLGMYTNREDLESAWRLAGLA